MSTSAHFLREIRKVDWNFTSYKQEEGINSLHWYPARFIPQIPAVLIGTFSEKDHVVLDPFMGSGTCVAEALRLGRRAIGLDSNSVAVMIARAKVALFPKGRLERAANRIIDQIRALGLALSERQTLFGKKHAEHILEQIPNLSDNQGWFHKSTLLQLGFIYRCIQDEQDDNLRNYLFVCFSSILRPCCSQENHWGYICDNVRPRNLVYKDALRLFVLRLQNAVKRTLRYYDEISSFNGRAYLEFKDRVKVFEGDARLMSRRIPEESVDLIVTSPPYVNVTDYANSQRLTFLWADPEDQSREAARKLEIGARFRRFRRDCVDEFLKDMLECIQEMRKVLKKGGYLCLVIGRSPSYRDYIREVVGHARSDGFGSVAEVNRDIARKRSLAPRLTREHIYILQKRA